MEEKSFGGEKPWRRKTLDDDIPRVPSKPAAEHTFPAKHLEEKTLEKKNLGGEKPWRRKPWRRKTLEENNFGGGSGFGGLPPPKFVRSGYRGGIGRCDISLMVGPLPSPLQREQLCCNF